jgi:hypothetical protein
VSEVKRREPRLFAASVCLPALLALAVMPACTATMPAVTMVAVDEHDGTPIAGVVALFWGTGHEGTITGHGGTSATLFAAEAVSDRSGELRFPKQDYNSQRFFLNTNYENPSMLLLSPGYAPLILHNERWSIPTLAQALTWEYDGKTVKMTKEIELRAYNLTIYTNAVAGFEDGCLWKRVPRAIAAADRLFPATDTLRFLVMNDALFVQHGCGSPKAFFAPYLRP